MRVILDESLFTARHIELLPLLACVALGYEERHLILCDPVFVPHGDHPSNVWLTTLDPGLRAELGLILDQASEVSMMRSGQEATIRIIAGTTSDWCNARLCVRDAHQLLHEPLHILLEDAINDLDFLRRLAPPALRRRLDNALERGWAIAEHAGGLGSMQRVLQRLLRPDAPLRYRILRLRHWVMFDRDSDASDRARPDPRTDRLLELLETASQSDPWPLAHYRLERRAIENYLPNAALERWARQGRGPQIDQRHKIRRALESLRSADHAASRQYNMKYGLLGDLDQRPEYENLREQLRGQRAQLRANLPRLAQLFDEQCCDLIFRGRRPEDRAALVFGFGAEIAGLYRDDAEPSFEQAFQEEYERGQHSMTREAIIEQLLQRL